MKFTCRDNMYYPERCRGINKSSGAPCSSKPRDINGFCGKHYLQSVEYANKPENQWSLISTKNERGVEVLTKVQGLIPGAYSTSNSFK